MLTRLAFLLHLTLFSIIPLGNFGSAWAQSSAATVAPAHVATVAPPQVAIVAPAHVATVAPPQVAAVAPASLMPPIREPGVGAFWEDSLSREARGDYLGAALAGEWVAEQIPDNIHVRWRIARNYMLAVEGLPADDHDGRRQLLESSRAWARRGRQLDTRCGECCLYDFASTARLAALGGPIRSMRLVREAGRTLEHCLASPPSWSDSPWSYERANLYHGAGVFLRLLPESRWFSLFSGVRGDKKRAIELGRRAVDLAPERVDYAVGLGAALLCHGSRRDDADEIAEGLRVLEGVVGLPDHLPTDDLDRRRAWALRADPSLACSNTREGQIHFE